MGLYLNPGNSGFEEILQTRYVDKTGMIRLINDTIGTKQKLTCVSRARRFGKSYAAQMLCAYYGKGCDSAPLFAGLEIERSADYKKHLNRYDVIYLDMTTLLGKTEPAGLVAYIAEKIAQDIGKAYPDVTIEDAFDQTLLNLVEYTGDKLVMIVDEWDAPIRETPQITENYLKFLRMLFKGSGTTSKIFAAAYMTGILPIKKDGSQSAISDFEEYTMLKPRQYGRYVGFTEAEVLALCEECGISFDEMKKWYDGYRFQAVGSVYNPNSVMKAIRFHDFDSYWTETSAAEGLLDYIGKDYNGLTRTVAELIGGVDVPIDTNGFSNDLRTFRGKDDVLTLLAHFGYLAYDADSGTVRIPNEEIRREFSRAVRVTEHTMKTHLQDRGGVNVADSGSEWRRVSMRQVTGARCVRCGRVYEAVPNLTNCACGGILDVEYDYDSIRKYFTKEVLLGRRDYSMWRYREILPVEEDTPAPPLRVGWSPLYEEPRLAAELGVKKLWVKDDGLNPTASLKDRASSMAVAKASEAGADVIACSSTGNAASSLAGNAAAAGMRTYIFVPSRAPKGKVAQLLTFGATVISVEGSYEETFELSKAAIDRWGWYNRNAAINPYLSEGKKTVSLEIMEQLGWQVPDYIAISVGDGCTIAGLWKGLKDLFALGFIDRLPRLISAQAEGCHPINRAIEEGADWRPMEENTLADSIAVGVPRNPDKALNAIRESSGLVVNVTDEEIMAAQKLLGRTCGVFGEPAGVTGTAGVKKLCEQGRLPADATVVSVVTGNGLKDVANAIRFAGEPITIPSDMGRLLSAFDERGIRP